MSDPFKNLVEQQRRLQEQQQKMLQEQLRKQQMYWYVSQQRKNASAKPPFSCSVCGSTSGVTYCPNCRRSFCRIHLPVKSFGNISLPAGKTRVIGHVCVLSRQSTPLTRPPPPVKSEEIKSDQRVGTMNKWKCPICDHFNPEDEDSCEECGFFNEEIDQPPPP